MLPRTYPTVEGAQGERRVSVKLLTAPQGQAGIDYIPVAPVQGANPPPESNTDNSSDSGGMLMTTLAYAEGAQEWIDYIPVYIDGPVPSLSVNAADLRPPLEALSWTRATSRCITDYQGNVHEIPASAKPRNGVRVGRNLVNSLLGTGWADNGTVTVAASTTTFDGETTARLTTTGSYSGRYQYLTWAAGTSVFVRLRFKYVSGTHTDILIGSENYQGKFSTSTGAYTLHTGTVDDYSTVENDDGSFTVWVKLTLSGANLAVVVYPVDAVVVDCHVDVTRARPGQTEPDEYVSNGVLATPYHDGIGVDGLKYFVTDENGALITGTRGYDRDETGAWVVSSDVDPIVPSIPVGVAQTNRITHPSDLSNAAWTKLGAATATAGYDAQIGTYTRVAGLAAAGANDVSITASGFTNDSRIEVALLLRAVTTSGLFRVRHPSSTANGSWDIDLAQVSTTRFERIDRFHPAVTINTEFTATAAGAGGVLLAHGDSGSGYSVDVARVAQVQGERVHEIPVEATAVSTINADVPSFTWNPNYATNNEGTFVFDFTPKAETSIQARYFQMTHGACYKSTNDDRLWQYDGTNSSDFGSQVEGTRTKVATSWETGVGRDGYRDGVSKFASGAYDGAWELSTMTPTGPMLLHELSLYPTALTAAQLQALSNG